MNNRAASKGSDRWLMLGLAWLLYFYFGSMAVSFAPILTTIERDLHTTSAGGGLLLGAYPLMYVVSALLIGRVCDRIGVKQSASLGLIVIALSMGLRSIAHSYGFMLFAAALLGVGGPVVSVVLPKLIAERFEGSSRTLASGVYVTGPAVGAALVLALTSRVFLPLLGSWRALYFADFLEGAAILVLWLLLARNVQVHATTFVVTGNVAEGSRSVRPASQPVWQMNAVWMVVLVGIASFTIAQGFASWLPTILEKKGFTASAAGGWASLAILSGVPGSIGICYLSTRLKMRNGRKRLSMVLLGCAALAVVAIASPVGGAIYPLLALQGIATGALMPLLMAMLMDLPTISAAEMATAAALYFTVGQVAGAGAPILIGWLRDVTGGFTVGMLLVACVAIAALLPAYRLQDNRRKNIAGLSTDPVTVGTDEQAALA